MTSPNPVALEPAAPAASACEVQEFHKRGYAVLVPKTPHVPEICHRRRPAGGSSWASRTADERQRRRIDARNGSVRIPGTHQEWTTDHRNAGVPSSGLPIARESSLPRRSHIATVNRVSCSRAEAIARLAWKRPLDDAQQSATPPDAKSSCPSAAFQHPNCCNCPASGIARCFAAWDRHHRGQSQCRPPDAGTPLLRHPVPA